VDLHPPQIEGFFHTSVDTLTAVPALCRVIGNRMPAGSVVVSPDVGRAPLALQYAECLGLPVVIQHKRRKSGGETEVTHMVGDVQTRACLIVDDVISTGGTIAESVKALLEAGARPEIVVAATHALLLPGARQRLSHEAISEVFVTDTVAVEESDWNVRKHEPTIVP